MNKLFLNIMPKTPRASFGYSLDYLMALLPSFVFLAIFISVKMLLGVILTLGIALGCELVLCFFLKKEFDLTLIARALLTALFIPSSAVMYMYILGGLLVFIFSEIKLLFGRYLTLESVSFSVILLNLIHPFTTPASTVIENAPLWNVSVLDLILGTKSELFGGMSIICLLFAYLFLAFRKRINFLNGAVFYAALILIIGFLYSNDSPSALYYVSFVALDPKIFFVSLLLITLGAITPANKKAGLVFASLAGALSGYLMLTSSSVDVVLYVSAAFSLISRPIDILICKIGASSKNKKPSGKV